MFSFFSLWFTENLIEKKKSYKDTLFTRFNKNSILDEGRKKEILHFILFLLY